jgi:hypothetical protein
MHILKVIAELHRQQIRVTPRVIARAVGADEYAALARIIEFCIGGYVSFRRDESLPLIDTPLSLTESAQQQLAGTAVEV